MTDTLRKQISTRSFKPASTFGALPILSFVALLTACSSTPIPSVGSGHLQRDDADIAANQSGRANTTSSVAGAIPAPVAASAMPPKPTGKRRTDTYSAVFTNIRVQELLFALARDARVNIDIHPGIEGTVTINAIDQTLPQILDRISKQVDMRWEQNGPNIVVMPDTPFLRTYRVDYVNMARDTTSTITITSQVGSVTGNNQNGGGNSNSVTGNTNSSQTRVENRSNNRFWDTLIQNVKDILRETDKVFPEGASETVTEQRSSQTASTSGINPFASGAGTSRNRNFVAGETNVQRNDTETSRRVTFREAASVIANPETGILSIRASSRQHEKIQEFLDKVSSRARKQVLIEASVAEVSLSNNYQQGIDWSRLSLTGTGFALAMKAAGALSAPASSIFALTYTNADSRVGNLSGTVKLLESFGSVKVLSSPKLSVLNNQTAILKVVDNTVYFTIESNTNQNANQTSTTFTTTVHSIPVGLVMNVTPQISDDGSVLLNVRPSISRIIGVATDPNPALKDKNLTAPIVNEIPIVRSREMESILRVDDGNIAVLGGLMEDTINFKDDGVPGASRLPGLGALFQNRNDTSQKTELVIFLRPVIIRDASVEGDYKNYRNSLPNQDFFSNNPGPGAWGPPPNEGGGTRR